MTDIKLPAAVVEAAARAIAQHDGWGFKWTAYEETARAALLAGLKAWPGAQDSGITYGKASTRIYILPLTENANAEA